MGRTALIGSLRKCSRLALYAGLAVVLTVAVLFVYLAAGPLLEDRPVTWADIDYRALDEVQLLEEYVRIDTTAATGSTAEGARFLARVLEEAGLPVTRERVGNDVNLWSVLEGEEPGAIVLHHHIDVEDIHEPDRWLYPPFEGHIELPWMHGRGTFDMKSVGIAQLLAFLEVARAEEPPRRSVIYLATAREETGSELGTQWILREHPELVERFDVVLTEGGVLEGRSRDDLKYWGTEFAQKQFLTLVACHPDREYLETIRSDLDDPERDFGFDPSLELVDEVRAFLPFYAPTRDREDYRAALAEPELVLRDREVFASLPGYVQAMFRAELHAFPVRAAAGGGWELPVKVHLLPGQTFEEVRPRLVPEWLFFGTDVEIRPEPSADHGSPVDHPVMAAIETTLRESYPDAPIGPMFLSWTATDSRFFRVHEIPSYGFTPFTILTTDPLRVAGPTERIALPGYVEGVAIYKRLLLRLTSPGGPGAARK